MLDGQVDEVTAYAFYSFVKCCLLCFILPPLPSTPPHTHLYTHTLLHTLHRRQALLCVLAKNCNEQAYVRLVEALCQEHQIKLLKV